MAGLFVSIIKRHNIDPTRENIATVEKIVRGVPRRGMPVSVETREQAVRGGEKLGQWSGGVVLLRGGVKVCHWLG